MCKTCSRWNSLKSSLSSTPSAAISTPSCFRPRSNMLASKACPVWGLPSLAAGQVGPRLQTCRVPLIKKAKNPTKATTRPTSQGRNTNMQTTMPAERSSKTSTATPDSSSHKTKRSQCPAKRATSKKSTKPISLRSEPKAAAHNHKKWYIKPKNRRVPTKTPQPGPRWARGSSRMRNQWECPSSRTPCR